MVDPAFQAQGHTWVVVGLPCLLVFLRSGMSPVWITSVTQVPASVGKVAEAFADVYPSPSGKLRRSFAHLTIARQVMERHREAFGVGPQAQFDEDNFIIRDAYTSGSEALRKTYEGTTKHRDDVVNEMCRDRLDYLRGDDFLQIGAINFACACDYLLRTVPRDSLPSLLYRVMFVLSEGAAAAVALVLAQPAVGRPAPTALDSPARTGRRQHGVQRSGLQRHHHHLARCGGCMGLPQFRPQTPYRRCARAQYAVVALLHIRARELRGFYWLLRYPGSITCAFFPAVLPLVIVLFAESIVRRHVSLPMKIYAAGGTVFFVLMALIGQLHAARPWWLPFCFEVSIIVAMAWTVWRADQTKLTTLEIRLNNAIFVSAMFAVPLVITDFREELTWIPRRLGAAGALIFVYVLVRMSYRVDTRIIVFNEVLNIFLRASIMALSFMAITDNLTAREFFEFFPLSLMFVLVFTIFYRVKAVAVESRGASFLQWLLHAKMTSLESFVQSLRHLALTQENVLLRMEDLARYDIAAIIQYLSAERRVLSLTMLRGRTKSQESGSAEIFEQLADILERYGMSHIGLASAKVPALLLFNSPLIPGAHFDEIKINLILKLCRILPQAPKAKQAPRRDASSATPVGSQ
jgi:hypothetical protein